MCLPQSRVKTIMKSSPDVEAVSQESLFLITKATVNKRIKIALVLYFYQFYFFVHEGSFLPMVWYVLNLAAQVLQYVSKTLF